MTSKYILVIVSESFDYNAYDFIYKGLKAKIIDYSNNKGFLKRKKKFYDKLSKYCEVDSKKTKFKVLRNIS